MFFNKRILYFSIALTPCAHGATNQFLLEKVKILPNFVLGPIANGAKQKLWKKESKINKAQLLRSALIAGSTASIVDDVITYIKPQKKITEQHPVVANMLAPSAIGTITANFLDTSTLSSALLPVIAMITGLTRWYNFQPKTTASHQYQVKQIKTIFKDHTIKAIKIGKDIFPIVLLNSEKWELLPYGLYQWNDNKIKHRPNKVSWEPRTIDGKTYWIKKTTNTTVNKNNLDDAIKQNLVWDNKYKNDLQNITINHNNSKPENEQNENDSDYEKKEKNNTNWSFKDQDNENFGFNSDSSLNNNNVLNYDGAFLFTDPSTPQTNSTQNDPTPPPLNPDYIDNSGSAGAIAFDHLEVN